VEKQFKYGVVEIQLAAVLITLSVLSATKVNPDKVDSRPLYGDGSAGYVWLVL
jgi:hypothetical protein